MVDYHNVISDKPYKGEYDNLLFFFKFMYEKIHQLYSSWYMDFPTQFLLVRFPQRCSEKGMVYLIWEWWLW